MIYNFKSTSLKEIINVLKKTPASTSDSPEEQGEGSDRCRLKELLFAAGTASGTRIIKEQLLLPGKHLPKAR